MTSKAKSAAGRHAKRPQAKASARKHRYAIVGTGSRATMFRIAICDTFKDTAALVALCDSNALRAANWAADVPGGSPPIYAPREFLTMLRKHKVQTVIVTSMDRTHHEYIIAAMHAGCDVITEKPMTIDADKCEQILQAQKETGRSIRVTFNYRYAPRNARVKEVLQSGLIGQVNSVHFEWLLDTRHGADYFRRWHRDKKNSGGLLVHKATHHFDLVNWWLATLPSEVCAFGGLSFYGKENQESHGHGGHYVHATGSAGASGDPYALDLDSNDMFRALYLEPSAVDGYRRDQNVFGDGISIEDDLSLIVRYRNQATMSYHLTAYSPWEGYRVMFNGTGGRLELEVTETSYVSAAAGDHNFAANVQGAAKFEVEEPCRLLFRPHWGEPQSLPIPASNEGGHGGADARMISDIFSAEKNDPLGCQADYRDGAWSILTGIAGNRSMAEHRIVGIDEFGLKPYLH